MYICMYILIDLYCMHIYMYIDYKTQYAQDTVKSFYDENKTHEWFHERYNPHKQREVCMYSYVYDVYICIYIVCKCFDTNIYSYVA